MNPSIKMMEDFKELNDGSERDTQVRLWGHAVIKNNGEPLKTNEVLLYSAFDLLEMAMRVWRMVEDK